MRILVFIIGLIGIVFLVRILLKGDDAIEASGDLQNSLLSPFLYLAYIVFGIAVVITLLYAVANLLKNPKQLKKALVSVGLFAVVILIGFLMAKGVETKLPEGKTLSATGSRLVGTGLYTFYFLTVIAIVLILISGLRKTK
ncbi:MAG: hypothetical protein KDD04_00280 [Sinomicrobium sp.]|nr:hypothetical protein [Sinomicrobium sp.]